jgi:diguanylate cyclase
MSVEILSSICPSALTERFAMRFLATPALQTAVIVLIAFVGMVGGVESVQDPYILSCVLGLMVLGLSGIGLARIQMDATGAPDDSAGRSSLKKSLENREQQLDRELATIASLIQSHLDANGQYSDSLVQAGRSLPSLAGPEKVRAIVGLLIDANEKMQRRTSDLSKSLEKSRSQVAALSTKLVEAQEIGMRDSLTSLGNRRAFDSNLAREIAEARAQGTELCLIMGDLDHFKTINDNFGHPFGDQVLKYFAELLSRQPLDGAIAARLGGEEFAVILPRQTLQSALRLTDQIRSRLEGQQWVNAQSGQRFSKITASFGVVRLGEADNEETLVKRADTMLYEAKRAGRNRIITEEAA